MPNLLEIDMIEVQAQCNCTRADFNPEYALENLFRAETTTKQIVTLTYLNSP
jgi:hypothetical protein